MAENVVFDNQQPVAAQDDPNLAGGMAPQEGEGGEGGGEPPSDDSGTSDDQAGEEAATVPGGIAGFFSGGRLKKILIALGIILLLIVIIILIIPKNQRGKDVELVWWGLWEDSATMQPIIDSFEKENPTIKINYIKQDPDEYRNTLITRINNGSGPDIFRYHNSWVPVVSKVLAPLPKDVIAPADFEKQYYKVIQDDLVKNGAIYGLPLGIDSIALFINKDLLSEAGLTAPTDWNQFIDAAKKMTVKDIDTGKIEVAGAALGTYENVTHAPDILSIMFLQQGINLNKISEAETSITDALTFYTTFSRGNEAVWDNSLDNSILAFARGQLAMYFGFSWDVFTIEQLKSNNTLNYGIYPVPGLAGGKSITVASYWVEGVSSRSKNQKEAMIFMNYLARKETLQKFYTEASKTRTFGEPYPRRDMAEELKENTMVYPFVLQMDSAGSSYFASDTRDGDTGLNKRANTYLGNTINAITQSSASMRSEIPIFMEGVGKVLKDYGIQ